MPRRTLRSVRRPRAAAPASGLSALLPVRRQSRGRERSRAGRVHSCVPRAAHLQRQFRLQHVALPGFCQSVFEPRRFTRAPFRRARSRRSSGPARGTRGNVAPPRGAGGRGACRHRPAAQEATGRANPARVPRAPARGDCGDRRQLGGGGEGQFFSRARQSQEASSSPVMKHLSRAELVDFIEASPRMPAGRTRHVSTCDECRAEADALRSMRALAATDEIPEPSPLFWDHFSARVADAVREETPGEDATAWMRWPRAPLATWAAAATMAVLVMMTVVWRTTLHAPAPSMGPAMAGAAAGNGTVPLAAAAAGGEGDVDADEAWAV